MNAERWRLLDRIFGEAREIPLARRKAFVSDACGPDDALQAEIVSLLSADDLAREFLTRPAFDQLADVFASGGWSLQPGERIGAYTVLRLLGSGGAGEVWRARDERLGRDVAIKILLPHLSTDTERVRRFAEEARAAGTLNNPSILTVYDVGEHNGVPFLVSECLEGRNLREHLASAPLPVAEVIGIGLGILRGLIAAHPRGIVHRDLKPENIFLTQNDGIKVLDFGLAKLQPSQQKSDGAVDQPLAGTVVGTAAYMAPEQIKGELADARTDLFAVGVMLYEMLGGRHPFRGDSTLDTLHNIIAFEPADLRTVNEQVPPDLTRIIMRLLQKPREARFQSAADLAWALEPLAGTTNPTPEPMREGPLRSSRTRGFLPWIGLTAVLAVAGTAWLMKRPRVTPTTQTAQFTWTLPPGMTLDSAPVVSPDSRHIAFVGKDATGPRLFVRELSSLEPRMVQGSERAQQPFWSPDSKWIGFFANGRLLKAAWPNGVPVSVTSASEPRGAAWSRAGIIIYSPDVVMGGLKRVREDGAQVETASLLETSRGDTSHWWPAFLPDGRHFLYFVHSMDDERHGVYLGSVDQSATVAEAPLFLADSGAVFAPLSEESAGVLLYVTNGRIGARRIDTSRLTVDTDVRTLGLAAGQGTLYHSPMMSASADVLAFAATDVPSGNRLVSVARNGEDLRVLDTPESQHWPRISPDGLRVARTRVSERNNPDVWVDDLERGTRVRVTMATEPDMQPVWSPDGTRLAFVSGNLPGRGGPDRVGIAAADGSGVVRTFPCPGEYCEPADWSHDGRLLLNVYLDENVDVWTVGVDDAASPQPLLSQPFQERDARFSPNGRWVAYVSDEAGRPEIAVHNIGNSPKRFVISADGGTEPVWRRDGQELFFVDPEGRLRSVAVHWGRDGIPSFGSPVRLNIPAVGYVHWGTQYDISPDGNRIYFLQLNPDAPPQEIHVVMGWRALLGVDTSAE